MDAQTTGSTEGETAGFGGGSNLNGEISQELMNDMRASVMVQGNNEGEEQ